MVKITGFLWSNHRIQKSKIAVHILLITQEVFIMIFKEIKHYFKRIKKYLLLESFDLQEFLIMYRFFSLFITSAYYLASPSHTPILLRIAISAALFLESYIFVRTYNMYKEVWMRKLLIIVETIGLAVIIVLTGATASPFLLHALNPALIATTLTPFYFGLAIPMVFLVVEYATARAANILLDETVFLLIDQNYFIVILILVSFVAQLFFMLVRKAEAQTKEREKQLAHIKTMYEAIGLFSSNSNPTEILGLFASYAKTAIDASKAILWIESNFGETNTNKKVIYEVRGSKEILREDIWYPYVKGVFKDLDNKEYIDVHKFDDDMHFEHKKLAEGYLFTVKIRSNSNAFGVLSVFFEEEIQNIEEKKNALSFLAELCAMALEKYSLEVVSEKMLLLEEKNRIAGELHDNATQNLFGVVHGISTLKKQENFSEDVNSQLKLFQTTIQSALIEIRETIYKISKVRNKEEHFLEEIKTYLDELGKLNEVKVELDYDESLIQIKPAIRRNLYRIIKESTSNAIRHGRCKTIRVFLAANDNKLKLLVLDDGKGFDKTCIKLRKNEGLGMINMKELTRNLNGAFSVKSELGKGTIVSLEIPIGNNNILNVKNSKTEGAT
ncbi:MAG: sensor histidine kinase [Alkaliphilus sp.]